MTSTLGPVPCPECGERQNASPGVFDPDKEPFGPLICMACGHEFTREEYVTAAERSGHGKGAAADDAPGRRH